jgi:hypothetical protein
MHRLHGKYVLLTGASQGLGHQLALDFAREGAAGLALVARNTAALRDLQERLDALAPAVHVLVISADLAQDDDIERVMATTLSAFHGRLDVLVNNASALGPTPLPYLLDYPIEAFRRVLAVNLIAPFLLIKKALPAMLEGCDRSPSAVSCRYREVDLLKRCTRFDKLTIRVQPLGFLPDAIPHEVVPIPVEGGATHIQHRLSTLDGPAHARALHPVFDTVATRPLDDPRGNGIARRQIPIVTPAMGIVVEVGTKALVQFDGNGFAL